jgi:hypothetical protein
VRFTQRDWWLPDESCWFGTTRSLDYTTIISTNYFTNAYRSSYYYDADFVQCNWMSLHYGSDWRLSQTLASSTSGTAEDERSGIQAQISVLETGFVVTRTWFRRVPTSTMTQILLVWTLLTLTPVPVSSSSRALPSTWVAKQLHDDLNPASHALLTITTFIVFFSSNVFVITLKLKPFFLVCCRQREIADKEGKRRQYLDSNNHKLRCRCNLENSTCHWYQCWPHSWTFDFYFQ